MVCVDDVLAAEVRRYERKVRREQLGAIAVVAALLTSGWVFYWHINGFPADHGLSALTDGYDAETGRCVVEVFEDLPLPGTLFGRFVVEPIYRTVEEDLSDRERFTGFRVRVAFGSEFFQIGDGYLFYYRFGEFATYADIRDCRYGP